MRTLSFLLILSIFTLCISCEDRNIRQVVKDIAEAPVDTTDLESKTIYTNTFSSVQIDCFADVTYHQVTIDETPHVELHATPEILQNLSVTVENEKLKVEVNRRYRMPEKEVAVINIYTPFISHVTVNGAKCFRLGKIMLASPIEMNLEGVGAITSDSITAPEINVGINGDGSVHLRGIATKKLRCQQKGSGILALEGHCETMEMVSDSTGFIDTARLEKGTQP